MRQPMTSISVATFNRLSISYLDWDKARTYLQEARKMGPGSWAYKRTDRDGDHLLLATVLTE